MRRSFEDPRALSGSDSPPLASYGRSWPRPEKLGQMNASLVKVPDPLPAGMRRCNYVHKELGKMWALLPKSDKEIWEKMAGLSCAGAPSRHRRRRG